MLQIASGVQQIPLTPRNGINAYLLGRILVDTGVSGSAKKLRQVISDHHVEAIALTHAHVDHAGSARKLSDELGLPVWVGAADREATESGKAVKSPTTDRPGLSTIAGALGDFPGVAVARSLHEGDELGEGFTVLDTPGHSPGHVSFWRASDRVLICGDVFFNLHPLTTIPGLRQPPTPFTVDPVRNRASERRLAELDPATAGFGHGPVIQGDAGAQIGRFVASLPD